MIQLAERVDLVVCARLLATKLKREAVKSIYAAISNVLQRNKSHLIRRKSENYEAIVLVLLVQCFETLVLRRETTEWQNKQG